MIVRIDIEASGSERAPVELFTQEEIDGFRFAILPFIRETRNESVRVTLYWRDSCDFEFASWILGLFAHHGKSLIFAAHEDPEPEFEEDADDLEVISERSVEG